MTKYNIDVDRSFTDYNDWTQWQEANRWVFDPLVISSMVDTVRRDGLHDPIYGNIPPEQIDISDTNYRENIVAKDLNSRNRAVLSIALDVTTKRREDVSVYAPEFVTPFAARLRSVFPRFTGSEYFETADSAATFMESNPTCTHQDVQKLTYESASFDLYISCEVLEHVPSVYVALSEAKRVLRPSGFLVATFPFLYMQEQSIQKAELVDGETRLLMEPEYHGNPMSAEGSLVDSIPGWNVLEQCRQVGFSASAIRFIASTSRGACGMEVAGIFSLIAKS